MVSTFILQMQVQWNCVAFLSYRTNKKPRFYRGFIICRLFFYRSANWANASASAAGDAFVNVDNVFVSTSRDSAYWAFSFTSTAGNAIGFNFVCHNKYLHVFTNIGLQYWITYIVA